jgi:hypothetical protein
MSAVSCGYHEREVQPLLEFSNGVAETAVPMRALFPRALRSMVGLPCQPARVTG